jgi:hypothetical protein
MAYSVYGRRVRGRGCENDSRLLAGEISSCNVIRDKETGMSRNFGFVNFVNPQEAQQAINSVNGTSCQDIAG